MKVHGHAIELVTVPCGVLLLGTELWVSMFVHNRKTRDTVKDTSS